MTNETQSNSNQTNAKLPATKTAQNLSTKTFDGKLPTLGGISIPEIAVLGAAGYVLWKNRSKVQSFLEQNGVAVPAILSGDFSDLLQKGASAIGGNAKETPRSSMKSTSPGAESARRHDA